MSNHTKTPQSDISGYNLVFDSDYDILNQGSIDHAKRYFEQKDSSQSLNSVDLQIAHNNSAFSVNSVGFIIAIISFIIFVVMLWDFINNKNT
jgi:hypothetical protein